MEKVIIPDPGLLKAFPMLAIAHHECPVCKRRIPNGEMIVSGPRAGYFVCACGFVFDPEMDAANAILPSK